MNKPVAPPPPSLRPKDEWKLSIRAKSHRSAEIVMARDRTREMEFFTVSVYPWSKLTLSEKVDLKLAKLQLKVDARNAVIASLYDVQREYNKKLL